MSQQNNKDFNLKAVVSFIVLGVLTLFIYDYFDLNNLSRKPLEVLDVFKEEQRELELLGKAELSYAGGTKGRNKNIEIGVGRINGTTILPGEEFSFKKFLGSVTPEDGFSEERVFLNGEVTRGLGGGLCQVSSTLFQSVVNSGLPVTERYNHSFSVVLYDVGLDATYSDPGPDLKFVNDTNGPVTIKGKTEEQKVVFEIYGVPDGRISSTTPVEITNVVDFPAARYVATTTRASTEPECVNSPQIGYTAKINYGILYPTGEYKLQEFISKYKPLQRVCYVTLKDIPGVGLR